MSDTPKGSSPEEAPLGCPFCGNAGRAQYQPHTSDRWHAGGEGRWIVVCPGNGCASRTGQTEAEAIAHWNRRSPVSPEPGPEVSTLIDQLDERLREPCDSNDRLSARGVVSLLRQSLASAYRLAAYRHTSPEVTAAIELLIGDLRAKTVEYDDEDGPERLRRILTHRLSRVQPASPEVSEEDSAVVKADATTVRRIASRIHNTIEAARGVGFFHEQSWEHDAMFLEYIACVLESDRRSRGAGTGDTKRLDYLDRTRREPIVRIDPDAGEVLDGYGWGIFGACETVREAIDAALSATPEKPR